MSAEPGFNKLVPGSGTSCLHFVLKPQESALEGCLDSALEGDAVVLMDTAVALLAQSVALISARISVSVYCLGADVQAHGLTSLAKKHGLIILDDAGLVELVCSYGHCLSWK